MARDLFPGTLVQLTTGAAAPNQPFTVFDDLTSGVDVTNDIFGSDGVTPYTPVTDSQGLLRPFRGPDGEPGPLFIDTGVGQRQMILSSTAQANLFVNVATLLTQVAGILSSGSSGLPAGTTLDAIPNGQDRLAMTTAERSRLAGMADGATRLLIGTTSTTAKSGDWVPTPEQINAVRTMSGPVRTWFRTAAQGYPTTAEGLQDGDAAFIEVS